MIDSIKQDLKVEEEEEQEEQYEKDMKLQVAAKQTQIKILTLHFPTHYKFLFSTHEFQS